MSDSESDTQDNTKIQYSHIILFKNCECIQILTPSYQIEKKNMMNLNILDMISQIKISQNQTIMFLFILFPIQKPDAWIAMQ